jgi:hypothetical protein
MVLVPEAYSKKLTMDYVVLSSQNQNTLDRQRAKDLKSHLVGRERGIQIKNEHQVGIGLDQ